jgi:hypothetical protein
MNMGIKVTVNYPDTEEGMQLLRESNAKALYAVLSNILTPVQLNMLMDKFKSQNVEKA